MKCFGRSLSAAAAFAALSQIAGCYQYQVIDRTAAAPGSTVRVRMSQAGLRRMGDSLGVGASRVVTGDVVSNSPASLALRVETAPMGAPGAQQGLFQVFALAPDDVLEVESRQLDKTRTGLIAAAVAGGAVAVIGAIQGHSTGSNTSTEPPSNFLRVPVLRLRF